MTLGRRDPCIRECESTGPAHVRHPVFVAFLSLFVVAFGIQTASAFEIFGHKFFESEEEEVTPVPDPLPYEATLDLKGGDDDLEETLQNNSTLVAKQDTPPSGEPGLIARALADQEQLIARLYGAARYGGTVKITVAGQPLTQVVNAGTFPHSAGKPVKVVVSIAAGPLFSFGQTSIRVAAGVETPPLDPVTFGLLKGTPARSGTILDAESAIVATLKKRGYPFAKVLDREIVADHATRTVDVTLHAAPGPRTVFGSATVEGAKRTDTDFILQQAAIPEGAPYTPDTLRKAEKNLRDLGIFSSARVVEAKELDGDGHLPLTIEVSERKRSIIGGGASWSSTEGVGLEAYWRHRNLFGRAEQLAVEGSVGRLTNGGADDLEYDAHVTFTKPGAFGPATSFSSTVGARQEKPETYESRSVYGKVRATRDLSESLTAGLGSEISYAREEDALGAANYALFGVFGEITWDTRDNILDPTEGFRVSGTLEPAYDVETGGLMTFVKGSASAYRAVDDAKRFVLAGRVAAGSVIGASLTDIQPSRRFYVGGGGSVRGYAYRNVGPRVNTSSGTETVGGLSFLEASAEARIKVTDTIGVVPFVDVGAAYSNEIPDFSEPLKVGAGVGLRYYTPIGPLRLDVAVPLDPGPDDPSFALYLGLSQAF
ncbi:autotransporter secretion outer membrane protein TamA [Breoghania corrubedonensis]|uniref:Autotransporter secretion outer membrane protein TamA n=1 Tax=Breoghania corrubedonensis TaxID=665038 RepID=A0A2T5VBC4_9HYPH|nr:autotransporter assembly complex family protein [Breoghania corrubedonensis]PTW61044.1 autotransporter secretion outer membrane protein TamA [Breoghania corrubedonensis]